MRSLVHLASRAALSSLPATASAGVIWKLASTPTASTVTAGSGAPWANSSPILTTHGQPPRSPGRDGGMSPDRVTGIRSPVSTPVLGLPSGNVREDCGPDELIESWTLVGADWRLVDNKSGVTRWDSQRCFSSTRSRAGSPAYSKEDAGRRSGLLGRAGEGRALRCSASTPGRGARSSTTGRRSARRSGPGRRARLMTSGGWCGWPVRCARWSPAGIGWRPRWCVVAAARRSNCPPPANRQDGRAGVAPVRGCVRRRDRRQGWPSRLARGWRLAA